MTDISAYELWFVTGSQHLYGAVTLQNVAKHSDEIARSLQAQSKILPKVINQGVVTTPDEILAMAQRANQRSQCIGIVVWMHTFSPAKMWIAALKALQKPILHFHSQYNVTIPWSTIDMDFMNENQSAHGGREFGFVATAMSKPRKVVVGHWQDPDAIDRVAVWSRVAAGWHAMQQTKVARIGDNMREVAVTEGNKVSAQIKFGFSVNGYSINDLEYHIDQISNDETRTLVSQYQDQYSISKKEAIMDSLRAAARIELALRSFLREGGFTAFTDTFENLGNLRQLPGIAVQRLMADGYGFGAEGDWKTAALLRATKVMAHGLEGGTSFMEDYTYDFGIERSRVLGSHMLEICPTIGTGDIKCEVHPLSIGGKEDPVRLVFDVDGGCAINTSLIDLGGRYRLLVNEVEVVKAERGLPMLPVARVLWDPRPNLKVAAHAWILAGGSHHTVFSKSITSEYMEDFAEMAGIESAIIDDQTDIRNWKEKLRWNQVYYHLFES